MRAALKIFAGIIAIGLIVYGMSPWSTEERWLLCLWSATLLGGFAVWPVRRQRSTGIYGGTQNLAMVLVIGFSMLTLQLLYLQVVKAGAIYSRTVTDDNGNITSNARPVIAGMKVKRGTIFDSQGAVLAENVVTSDDFSYRTYPIADTYNIEAFAHVLGFASTVYGLAGIEDSYNAYLTGERGSSWQSIQNDLLNHPQEGHNLQLTINAALQQRAYDALGGRVGSVVVLDVKTGAVRALVGYPAFDPRQLTLNTSADNWSSQTQNITAYWQSLLSDESHPLINRPLQGQYPPGSTFKTVTAVGVLNSPEVGKPEEISCPNEFQADPQVSMEFAVHNAVQDEANYIAAAYGPDFGLDAVYAYSCNTAFAQYGLRLQANGNRLLEEQAKRFHVYPPSQAPDHGDMTDLPSSPSLLYVQEDGYWNRPAAIADTAFGQGQLLVTPLEMAQVAQAIANGGDMMKPYLVERVMSNANKVVYQAQPKKIGTPLSGAVARRMFQAMRAVIEKGWPGAQAAAVPGYVVGGKSGTAENPLGAPHAWFIEIGPLDDPKYAVAVMVENGGEGTSVGGALAGQVMQAALEINP